MSPNGDFDVPPIKEKKSLLNKKISYAFRGNSYQTLEQAETARNHEIEHLRVEADEKDRISQTYSNYDNKPKYLTAWITTSPISDKRDVWFGLLGQEDTGLAAMVDVPKLSEGIYQQTRELALTGYEVISITPVNSGVGGYKFPGGNVHGGAGWGYSFTQGVIITARQISDHKT